MENYKNIDPHKRIATGERLIKQWRENIKFLTERIEIQQKEGYDGRFRERQYYPLDIQIEQKKIDDAKAIISKLKKTIER